METYQEDGHTQIEYGGIGGAERFIGELGNRLCRPVIFSKIRVDVLL